jgi:hypothetical protein
VDTPFKGHKDVVVGTAFAMIGVSLFLASQQYEIGTAVSMGPGYFPALCGIALALLGVASVVKGVRAKTPDPISWTAIEPLLLILLSMISFGLLVERAGLVVATFVCLFFACFRRIRKHPLEVFLTFLFITAFNILVFIYAFEMTIPVFWWDR